MMKHSNLCRFAIFLRAAIVLLVLLNAFPAIAANDLPPRTEPLHPTVPLATSYGTEWVHIANSSNISGHVTYIDHPLTNGNANAIVIVTPNWNPGNAASGVYDNHPIGVYYTGSQWAIFNQDGAAMPVNAAFNVLIPNAGAGVFVQTASAGNIECASNCTRIDNPLSNGNPNAILFVTQNWNPGGSGGTYNSHPIGVYYTGTNWDIFNQDIAAMPVGASFNVMILNPGSGAFVQTATAGNTFGNYTLVDNSVTNNNPNAIVFATPNYNPPGGGGGYNNHNIGVFYASGSKKTAVFNQDMASIPLNAAFNILIAPLNTAVFVHTATAGNIVGNHTFIDNSLANNNPNAIILVTSNYSPGGVSGTYEDHPIGVFYNSGNNKWAIFNQDGLGVAMPPGAAFNVMVFSTDVAEFVHKATASNITANWTDIYYPLTNNKPNAIVFTTPNWNPGNVGGTYDNSPIGVYYDGPVSQWAIFNQVTSLAMPTNAAFNVFVPPSSPAVFVQTTTAGNRMVNATVIDNPLTNNNPAAMLFVTPNYNPGGAGGTYNKHNIGVWYDTSASKWAIFNQDLVVVPLNAAFNVFVTGNRLMLPLIMR